MSLRFLITGGEGFIGRNLASALRNSGNDVKTIDIAGKPDYKFSITDKDAFHTIKEKFDCIFHLAAVTSPPQFEEDPGNGLTVNINGTFNVLDYASRTGTRKVVIASSSAIYGDSKDISVEEKPQDTFMNLYPVTKVTDEYLARYFSVRGDLECVALRYFNTFGSGENTKGMYSSPIHKFLLSAMHSEDIDIFGDGKQSRDFIYVKDTVKATILAFEKGRPGESYNVGTGISTDFNRIAAIIKEVTGSSSIIRHVKNPFKSYQMFTKADMSKSERELGFKPSYDLESAIREMKEAELTAHR